MSVVLLLAFCAGALACAGAGDDERRPPRIELAAERRDFGRVEQGAALEAEFGFRNAGEFDLELTDLRTAEDCLARIDGPARIRPGRTGAIRTRFETGAVSGVQERTVTIYSNDPERRVITLALRADVALDVTADPPRVWAGTLPRGAALLRTIAIHAAAGSRVTAVRTSKALLGARLLDSSEGGAAPSVAVAIAADAPLGPFDADVELVTASTRHPVLRVPVSGIVVPDVIVTPPRLELGRIDSGTAPSVFLMVQNLREAHPVRLTAVEIDERLGRAEIDTLAEGARYRVKLELAEQPAGVVRGVVRLLTDHPEQPSIEVAIGGEVAGGGAD